MSEEKLYIFDTTLRDGAQTQGVDFSIDDKIKIAEALDKLGVDYIEGGWPGANPTDTEFFQRKIKFNNSKLTAFGMTKKSGRSAENDPGLSALLNSKAPAICLVGKTWDFHVDVALGIFFYVIIYTVWLKRLNSSNIVIGGFAGSAASMAGWSAATGSIDILGFLIGFLVFVWTPSHFWCLAMKLRDDYAEANVPMLPVLIGMERTSKYILANTIILLPYSLLLYAFGMGIVYTIIASIAGGLMLVYHYKLTKTPTSDFAWKAYKVTAPYLTIIFVGIALDAAFHFRF